MAMKLLLRPGRGVWRLVDRGFWFSCAVLTCLAAIEFLGRQCRSDWQDALLVVSLVIVALSILLYQRRRRLGWVDRLTAVSCSVGSWWRRHSFAVGVDLRGQPPLAHRCPGPIRILVIALAVWAPVMAVSASHFPEDARAVAVRFCYLAYLVVLIALWSLLIFGIAVSAF